ncbi:hypothetical protein R3P38DRAFT_2844164 [Favolaschia claudopus]|uniref:F-box domain-containing protein n=1 Tax=Favolaschia claudopus TaxID=2862362 RepID=A0AAW0DZW0_9AGAR
METSTNPILPPDLEREIFETAALQNRRHIHLHPLLFVCRRVYRWIEPFLYRVLPVLSPRGPRFLAFYYKPATFKQESLRHVWVDDRVSTPAMIALLSECPRLQSFCFDGPRLPPELLPLLDTMQIQNLSIRFDSHAMFPRSMFLSVTHLELVGMTDGWANLALLPVLTHLSLSEIYSGRPPTLDHCIHLQAVVINFHDWAVARCFEERLLLQPDPRMVVRMVREVFNFEEWEKWAWGEDNYWSRADAFLARKRRGEIKGSCYLLEH